ncbi:hypothetical protein CJ030_MR3G026653 [Morella rubra]|uniref:Protein kinase domain-containing protein n=1 Tax=Morella rubra TaxID=262757 RepID=A0A6A1W1M2_9ROSI|nr:hypothetical protein CJ030_MR3G026653 [Morella rubra]
MAKTVVSACFLAILFVFTFLAYAAELRPPHYPVTRPDHHHQGGKQTVHEDGARLEAELVPSHYPVTPDYHQGGNQQTGHEDGAPFNAKMKGKSHRPVETLKVPFTLRPCRSSLICQKRCLEIYPKILLYGKCVKGIFFYRCVCVPKKKLSMNLLGLLLPMWVLSTAPFSAVVNAGSQPAVSSFSEPVFVAEREPISQFSLEMEAESPEAAKGIPLNPIMVGFNSLRMVNKKSSVAIFDYQSLEAATNNFHESNLLGEGGSGRIYKACFDEKFLAAVKRIDGCRLEAEVEFENEVYWLSKIRHQNIVKLLGYCIYGELRFLVYEMMEKESLEAQLHGPSKGSALTWHLRMKIAVDVARGLEYLHEQSNPPVVHRDIRSCNILLDSNLNAKLSDFGLAVTSGTENKNITLSGTLGHVAPEYVLDGKLTDKSDVYAFGVVLLELLMGSKPLENAAHPQCQSIVAWAMPQLADRSKLPTIVDPVIKNTMDLKHLYQVAAVAVLCVQPEPSYRPLITDVLHSLIPLVPLELGGSLRVVEPTEPSCPGPSH